MKGSEEWNKNLKKTNEYITETDVEKNERKAEREIKNLF